MAVDPNISRFVDLAVNDPEFRAALDSEDRDRIIDALGSSNGFDLTDAQKGDAADAWIQVGNHISLDSLEKALSHSPRTLGN